jgi:hypothetical protein
LAGMFFPCEAKLVFENYRGNELEMGLYGPKFEAEGDLILSHYLQECGQETSIFIFRFEASRLLKRS